jgi:hypothetical protein
VQSEIARILQYTAPNWTTYLGKYMLWVSAQAAPVRDDRFLTIQIFLSGKLSNTRRFNTDYQTVLGLGMHLLIMI